MTRSPIELFWTAKNRELLDVWVEFGFGTVWVNHDQHYVDPVTGDHTNKIESSWFAVKRQLPRGGTYDLKRFF